MTEKNPSVVLVKMSRRRETLGSRLVGGCAGTAAERITASRQERNTVAVVVAILGQNRGRAKSRHAVY